MSGKLLLSYTHLLNAAIIFLIYPPDTNTESTSSTNKELLQFNVETSKFIVKSIVSRYLSGCSVILLADLETSYNNGDNFSQDMSSSVLSLIHLKEASTATLLSNFNATLKPISAIPRLSSAYKLAISAVSTVTQQLSDSVEYITSTDYEITRRDEDYYVFVAGSEPVGRSLLLSQITLMMRYKIVMYPNIIKNFDGIGYNIRINMPTVFIVKSVCLYCPTSSSKIMDVFPSASKGLDMLPLSQIFPDTTRNLHKHTIKISAPTKYKATYEMEKVNEEFRHKRGIHTFTFNIIAAKINATYVLQPCTRFGNIPPGATGILLGNGTWAGCMGDVLREVSDMSLSVSPDDKRFESVHFSSPLEFSYISFATSKPKLFYSWKSIFKALDGISWTFLIASILITAITIHLMDYCMGLIEGSLSKNLSKLSETGFYLLGYVVGQDAPPPRSISSKFSYVAWLLYGLVIGSIYTCSLQALIVSPGLEFVPETFSELVNSRYKWGAATAFRGGLGEQLFKNSKNPIMRAIYHSMDGDKDETSCTQRALSKYACFNWEMMQQFRLQTEFADKSGNHPFKMAKEMSFFTSLNFITRKRELFRSQFNDFISRSYNTGFARQTINLDWRAYRLGVVKARMEGKLEDLSQSTTEVGPRAFKFSNVKGCFGVLACGLVVSLIGFVWEKVKYYAKRVHDREAVNMNIMK